jgi:hypothetical protein
MKYIIIFIQLLINLLVIILKSMSILYPIDYEVQPFTILIALNYLLIIKSFSINNLLYFYFLFKIFKSYSKTLNKFS